MIICLAGLAMYLICQVAGKYAEIAEIGRLAFFAGLLAWLLMLR